MKSKHQNINSQQKECLTYNEKMHFIILLLFLLASTSVFFGPDPQISSLTRYKTWDFPHSDFITFMNCNRISRLTGIRV